MRVAAIRATPRERRFDQLTLEQCGPVGDDLFHLRAAASKSGHARWTGQYERRNLPRKAFDRLALARTDTDPQHHLGDVGIGLAAETAVRGVHANQLRENLLEVQPQRLQSLAEDRICGLRLVDRIGPRVDQRADGLVSIEPGDRHLQHRRARGATNAGLTLTRSFPPLLQLDRGEIRDTIRRDVFACGSPIS